jgi:hypothetical protein
MADVFSAEKLSLIKKYPTEILVLLLLTWCGYMQVQLTGITKEKEKYLIEDRQRVMDILEENTRVIERHNQLFEEALKNGIYQNNISQQSGYDTGPRKPKNR